VSDSPSPETRAGYAVRARRAYLAMRRQFGRSDGRYRPVGWRRWLGLTEHLWPVSRALVSALDLSGIPGGGTKNSPDPRTEIDLHLRALESYWDGRGDLGAYASDPPGTPFGGDRYYDDNAWVGLALVQLARMGHGRQLLPRAQALWGFARSGWDERPDAPHPGGVFWVEQGRGAGRRNHDRNTVSTAPNAALGLHLDLLSGGGQCHPGPRPGGGRLAEARRMYSWVEAGLRVPAQHAGDGLYWDKIRTDGTIDRALWSYNQGNMIGLNLLLARSGVDPDGHLGRAEEVAERALRHYAGRWIQQPAAFNAIFARNLLALHHASRDAALRERIIQAVRRYADEAWERRDAGDIVHLSPRPTVLDQSAVVSLLALLAWNPADYDRIT
jgi:hypothetical protein